MRPLLRRPARVTPGSPAGWRIAQRLPTLTVILTCLVLAAAGCAGEPPQKEIDQAQVAVELARAAAADRFAPEEFTAAATGLQKAHDAVDQRDYRQALSYAIDARQRAQNAIREATDAKSTAKRGLETQLADVTTRVKQLETRVKAAEAARPPAKELRAPRAAIADAQRALQEAGAAIGAENFAQAGDLLTAVRKKLDIAGHDVENIPQRGGRSGRAKSSAPRKGLPPTP